jgi:hypothetical protein
MKYTIQELRQQVESLKETIWNLQDQIIAILEEIYGDLDMNSKYPELSLAPEDLPKEVTRLEKIRNKYQNDDTALNEIDSLLTACRERIRVFDDHEQVMKQFNELTRAVFDGSLAQAIDSNSVNNVRELGKQIGIEFDLPENETEPNEFPKEIIDTYNQEKAFQKWMHEKFSEYAIIFEVYTIQELRNFWLQNPEFNDVSDFIAVAQNSDRAMYLRQDGYFDNEEDD